MSDVGCQWSLSNPWPETLLVWLEPWAEEFEVPVRSMIALSASGETKVLEEVEWTADHLVLWASPAGAVNVFVDGTLQESASALFPISLLAGGIALVAAIQIFRLATLQLESFDPHADGQAGMGPVFGAAYLALVAAVLTFTLVFWRSRRWW